MFRFNTIYLYRSAGLGDVLWTEPLIRQLSARYRKVVLFTLFPELFDNYPLQNVRVKGIPSGWYRWWLKLLNNVSRQKIYYKLDGIYEASPKMHMLHAYQQYFGLPFTGEYPRLYLNEDEKRPLPGLPGAYAILHLDSNAPLNYRKVHGVKWEEVVAWLGSKNIPVLVVGNAPPVLKGTVIYKGTLRQLIQLVDHCRIFIGVDSGPAHIAASLQKPALIFFGSVNPVFRHFPQHFKGYFLQQPCEFAGCYHEVISGKGQSCRLVGDDGVPPCTIHTAESVKEALGLLLEKYTTAGS